MKNKAILLLIAILTLNLSCNEEPSEELQEECLNEHFNDIYDIRNYYDDIMSTFCNTCSEEDCDNSVDITNEYLEYLRQMWSDLGTSASNCSEDQLREIQGHLDFNIGLLEDKLEVYLTNCP